MTRPAPLHAHLSKDKLTLTDASKLAVIAEIPSTNFSLRGIGSGLLLSLDVLVDTLQIDRGSLNIDLTAGAEE